MADPDRLARAFHGHLYAYSRGGLSSILLFLFCVMDASGAVAQSKYPIVAAGGTHAMTFPWHLEPVAKRLNPAFMIGTDRSLRSGDRWSLFAAVNLGFVQHHWWMTGVSLEPELGVGCGIAGGLHADARLGLGYMHFFWRRKSLELENGRYVQATDWGTPSLIVPLSLTLGYRGDPDHPPLVSPFVSARWAAHVLFLDEIPIVTHLFFFVGVRIEWGRRPSSEGG